MKTQIKEKVKAFIIVMMFSFTCANAQTCPANKVWACRTSNCVQQCRCVYANNVTYWQANGQPCHIPCTCQRPVPASCRPYCSPFRSAADGSPEEIALTGIYPNPVSESATLIFYLDESENVSIQIFDMTGRVVKTLADDLFMEGENKIEWNAENINTGLYFLRMAAGEYSQTEKFSVVK